MTLNKDVDRALQLRWRCKKSTTVMYPRKEALDRRLLLHNIIHWPQKVFKSAVLKSAVLKSLLGFTAPCLSFSFLSKCFWFAA